MQADRVKSEVIEYDVRTDEMLINMGPQHPSTHGVLRVVLRTDGEVVSEVTPHIGYLHRCAEKIAEKLAFRQYLPFTDRLDYLASMNMNLGWALTGEKLLGHRVSEKTRHLRVIISELNRIASHLVAAGCMGLDLGSFTPFMWTFREREKIVNLFEEICGARLTYSYLWPGGVIDGPPDGWFDRCLAFLDQFEPVIDELHALLTNNAIFIKRSAGVGVLPPEMAINYGCTGPVLRASGVDWDLRRDGESIYTEMYDGYTWRIIAPIDGRYPDDHPYPPLPYDAVVGDSWHRFYVRMLEVVQSMYLIRQGIEKYNAADGELDKPFEVKKKLPAGEAYLETEAPKGQMGFGLVGDGTATPWRARIRSSSFFHVAVLGELCRGVLIADMPTIIASMDIVLGEIDR
ncbi:MAG: NADH-quinone oxidoreductase subunit D [Pirellulales bacterium]|nr:NADH-quinone oxidoreductase subunit D [Pirellulales bacterium]